jgi:hypothetical protein
MSNNDLHSLCINISEENEITLTQKYITNSSTDNTINSENTDFITINLDSVSIEDIKIQQIQVKEEDNVIVKRQRMCAKIGIGIILSCPVLITVFLLYYFLSGRF